jgi:Bbp16-like protein
MILDAENRFSNAQAVTSSAVGQNVLDLGSIRDVGSGGPLAVLFIVGVAADQTTGDEDYTFDVEVASAAAQNAGVQLIGRRVFESGTPTAPAQDADLLVAGFQFYINLPPMKSIAEAGRYLGVRYVTAGTTPTITVSAYLVPSLDGIDTYKPYAKNYTIS